MASLKTQEPYKLGKKIRELASSLIFCLPSDDLLSQGRWPQLPSALESLTSVFGMGTGVSSPLLSLGKHFNWTDIIIFEKRFLSRGIRSLKTR
jgi:hypothetical protein